MIISMTIAGIAPRDYRARVIEGCRLNEPALETGAEVEIHGKPTI